MRRGAAALVALTVLGCAPGALAADVHVTASIAPRPMRFGDVIHATLVVRGDAEAAVQEGFSPFQVLRRTSSTTSDGGVTVTTLHFDLQCLEARCAPGPGPRTIALAPSRVRVGSAVVTARFPQVRVITRVTAQQVARPRRSLLHPISPPPPDYRVAPSTLRLALVVAAIVLVLIALALLAPLMRSRRRAAQEAPVDALARAIALVRAARTRPPADRRRALALLARTLRTRAEPVVAQDAADLAWSEPEPDPDRMTRLADRVEGAP
ncbi:MAG: hypothetical protein ABI317_12120 [Gaiellales bacterium]